MFRNHSEHFDVKHFSSTTCPEAFLTTVFRHFTGISSAKSQMRFCEKTTFRSDGSQSLPAVTLAKEGEIVKLEILPSFAEATAGEMDKVKNSTAMSCVFIFCRK